MPFVCAGCNGGLYFAMKGTGWQWQIAETVKSTAQERMLCARGDVGLEVKQYLFLKSKKRKFAAMIEENVGEAGIGVLAEWGAGEDEISCVPAEVAIFFANATQNQMDDGSCGGKGLAEARWVDPAKVCEPNSCCRVMDILAKQKGYSKALQQFYKEQIGDLEDLAVNFRAQIAPLRRSEA